MLVFLSFCLHLCCLSPIFLPPVCFSAEGFGLHFTHAFSSLPGATCSVTPVLKPVHKCVVGCSALTHCCCQTHSSQEGHCCLQSHIANPIFLEGRQLQSRSEQEGCYGISCAASPAPFPLHSHFSFFPALAQGAAPLCQQGTSQHRPVGAWGTTAKGRVKPTWPGTCLPHSVLGWVFSCARLWGTRRGIRQKAWLRLFLYTSLCPTRENQHKQIHWKVRPGQQMVYYICSARQKQKPGLHYLLYTAN